MVEAKRRSVVLVWGAHPESAVGPACTSVFSTLVVRVADGPAIAGAAVDDAFLASLSTMVRRYLLRP